MNCKDCDNFQDDCPIKVTISSSPLGGEVYYFEDGFKCTWNGVESLKIEDLQKGSCRCRQ